MRSNRRRYHRHGDMGRGTYPENFYHEQRGEYGHRYSENMQGEPYGYYPHPRDMRSSDWDQNPGGGSYGYNHYSRHMGTNDRDWEYGRDDRSSEFRARNTRYRNHLRGYRRRRDYNFDIDRENLFREYGSVDEHLNRSMRGARYDHW